MKRFSCGDVVPGCSAEWVRADDDALLAEVAAHARADHGLTEISDDLIEAVRANIHAVPA